MNIPIIDLNKEFSTFSVNPLELYAPKSFHLNENQIYELSKGYNNYDKFFNIHVLQKWILFIDLFDQIWEIVLTSISKNL